MNDRIWFHETDVENMLRTMFFIGALEGARFVKMRCFEYDNLKHFEDRTVKMIMDKYRLKEK